MEAKPKFHYQNSQDVFDLFIVQNIGQWKAAVIDTVFTLVGLSLSGAGGGGFLCVVTKEPNMHAKIKQILDELEVG